MLTKQDRQDIVDSFIAKHGKWDVNLFVDELESGHWQQAHSWFEFDDGKAARAYRVEQARRFVHGLKVRFEVETIQRGRVKVIETTAPAFVSPVETRHKAGGYRQFDPNDPAHMSSLCGEAASALQSWLDRYESALLYAGQRQAVISKVVAALEAKAPQEDEAA